MMGDGDTWPNSSVRLHWWRRRDFHGHNWIREFFIRPGTRVLCVAGAPATVVRREHGPMERNVTVRPDFTREGNVNDGSYTEIWWMGNLRIVL
jgi:hypothetical protein